MFASTNACVKQQSYDALPNSAIQSSNQQKNFNSLLDLNRHHKDPQLVPKAGERSLAKAVLVPSGVRIL